MEGFIVTGSKQLEIGMLIFIGFYALYIFVVFKMTIFTQIASCQKAAGNMVLKIHVPAAVHYPELH